MRTLDFFGAEYSFGGYDVPSFSAQAAGLCIPS